MNDRISIEIETLHWVIAQQSLSVRRRFGYVWVREEKAGGEGGREEIICVGM